MTGLNRAAVVIAVLVAGVLTIARTGEGGVMSSGMVRVSRSVAHGAERTVNRITGAFVRFFEDEDVREVANVDVRVRTREGSAQQAGGDFTWRGVVATGEAIEVKGVNGSVIAELASGNEIEVRAEKTSRRSDPDDVHVEVIEHSGGVTICAIYPSSGGRQNTCEPGSGGRNRVRNNDVKVTFYVKVPAGVTFTGRTVNGSVEVNDLASDVTANSVNGDIEITTTGFAEASTVNGSIEAEMGRYDLSNGLNFSTVNGSISLDLPDDVDANVDARWVNGSLEAELPLKLIGRLSRHAAQGVLGEGGPELNLKTVNGSIRIY
jgi:hypothetical protein